MKRHQYASLLRRIGTVTVVIGLAFSLAALLAENTHAPQIQGVVCFQPGGCGPAFSTFLPAHTYDVVCCDPPFVSPKEFVSISAGPVNSSSPVDVYLLKNDERNFQTWVSGNGSSSTNFFYGEGDSSLFLSYLSSQNGRLVVEYEISPGGTLQTQFYPQDVEQLMVVLLNPTGVNATFPSFVTQTAVVISPSLGIESAAGFIIAGGVLFAVGYVMARPKQVHAAKDSIRA